MAYHDGDHAHCRKCGQHYYAPYGCPRCFPPCECHHPGHSHGDRGCLVDGCGCKEYVPGTRPPCNCGCHQHQGTFPTSKGRPCKTCGHVDAEGTLGCVRVGGSNDWYPNEIACSACGQTKPEKGSLHVPPTKPYDRSTARDVCADCRGQR